ncbi:MAG: hypothetical protein WC755_09095, partial [Candidatus Woesearchaeota archaeon]
MKLDRCDTCEGCEEGARLDVVPEFKSICLTDPVVPIQFSETLVKEAVVAESKKDKEVTEIRDSIKDVILAFLSEDLHLKENDPKADAIQDAIFNETYSIYDELSKMGFYKIWDYETLKTYLSVKVIDIYKKFYPQGEILINVNSAKKAHIQLLLRLLGSKNKVPFYLTNLLATRNEVSEMPLSSIWRETTERTVRAKYLFENDFIPKLYNFTEKRINGEFDDTVSDSELIVDEDFISTLNDLDVESLNGESLPRAEMGSYLFEGESSGEIKPDKQEFYLTKFNSFFDWDLPASSENKVNQNKVNFRDSIFKLLCNLMSSLRNEKVAIANFPKSFKEALDMIAELKNDFVYSDKNEPFKISRLEKELVELMHSFYKIFEELEIAHKGKLELNELGEKMNGQILNILQEDICPNVADCNDPSALAKIISETLPFNEETFKIFVDAVVKLDFMLVADILSMVHNEEDVYRFSSYLRDKFSMHVVKDNNGNVILNPDKNGELVDNSIIIKDLCVHDGKSFQSIFEKMIPQAFARPESIGDKIRFMIVLSDEDSKDLTDGLKSFKEGGYDASIFDFKGCLENVSKIHGILCAILGTNIDMLELQSSFITGGTKIFSTGGHVALHCNIRARLYDKEKKKMVSYPVECQIRHADSDPKGDHEVYRENKIKHIKERYGMNFSFGDFLIAALSTFKKIKNNTMELPYQDSKFLQNILIKSFGSFDNNGKLLNEGVFIEIADMYGVDRLESLFKTFVKYCMATFYSKDEIN